MKKGFALPRLHVQGPDGWRPVLYENAQEEQEIVQLVTAIVDWLTPDCINAESTELLLQVHLGAEDTDA